MTTTRLAEILRSHPERRSVIAAQTGMDESRLDAIAASPSVASMQEIRGIASALQVRPSELLAAPATESGVALMFRRSLGKKRDAGAYAAASELSGRINKISSAFSFEAPTIKKTVQPMDLSLVAAERTGVELRAMLGYSDLDPLASLPRICSEKLGIYLFVVPKLAVEGASAVVDGQKYIFLAPRTHLPRMLFTLAHELGHILLHASDAEFGTLDFDLGEGVHNATAAEERFANAFASALLLPAGGVGLVLQAFRERAGLAGDQVGDIEILVVARFFGVSFEVAARRLEALDLLPEGAAASLIAHIKKEDGSPEQRAREAALPPAAEVTFPQIPHALLHQAIELVRLGKVSIGKAAQTLSLSVADFMAQASA